MATTEGNGEEQRRLKNAEHSDTEEDGEEGQEETDTQPTEPTVPVYIIYQETPSHPIRYLSLDLSASTSVSTIKNNLVSLVGVPVDHQKLMVVSEFLFLQQFTELLLLR